MPNQIELTREEMIYLELAIELQINYLRNKFEDEPGYHHPAIKYENLHKKIEDFRDQIKGFGTFIIRFCP